MNAPTMYVVAIGIQPLAASTVLETAQDHARTSAKWYQKDHELRWDECRPGREWRLMHRATGRPRFSWTGYAIFATPNLDATGSGHPDRSAVLREAADGIEARTLLHDDCPCVAELRRMADGSES